MRRLLTVTLAAAFFAAPAGVAAHSPPQAEEPDEIVVQGQKSQRKKIQSFIKTLSPAKPFEQFGRFYLDVCPAAVGLGSAQNAQVVARIHQCLHSRCFVH